MAEKQTGPSCRYMGMVVWLVVSTVCQISTDSQIADLYHGSARNLGSRGLIRNNLCHDGDLTLWPRDRKQNDATANLEP